MSSFDRDQYRSDDPDFERDYAAEADDFRKRMKEDALHETSASMPPLGAALSGGPGVNAVPSNDAVVARPD